MFDWFREEEMRLVINSAFAVMRGKDLVEHFVMEG